MRFISASQVFSGTEFYKQPMVLVLDDHNRIHDIVESNQVETSNIEHFDGILCPGFINTHCHLELSHLKNEIHKHTGIVDFALNVIKKRNNISEGLQIELMQDADTFMQEQGIVAVGDISNSNLSIATKKNSSLYYHTFVELISLNPERATLVFDAGKQLLNEFKNAGLAGSLAPHAPYSVSTSLIKLISDFCLSEDQITSIHNQESKAEDDFFKHKSGDFLKLYQALNIPIDYFEAPKKSSLQTVLPYIDSDLKTLLVHNTFTSEKDLLFAKQQAHLFWCLCPNANLHIENTLPNISELIKYNCTLTLGTDSLASNDSLSIIDEINCILNYDSTIDLEVILKAATYNGACFLGKQDELGVLQKNAKSGINFLKKEKRSFVLQKIA